MKKTGIVILVVGIILTCTTGFSFFTKEKVVAIGNVEITADKKHTIAWPPILGLAMIAAGAGVIFLSTRKAAQ